MARQKATKGPQGPSTALLSQYRFLSGALQLRHGVYVHHALNWSPPGIICTTYFLIQSLQRSLFTPASWRGHLQIFSPRSPAKDRCRLLSVHSGDRNCASSTVSRKNKLELREIEAPVSHANAKNIKELLGIHISNIFESHSSSPLQRGGAAPAGTGRWSF